MTKTIIVPIDLNHAEKADEMVAAAARLGGPDAKLVLTNVFEEIPTFVAAELPGGFIDQSKAAAKKSLEELATRSGIEADIEVRSGQASRAIVAVATEKHADGIVIASHRPAFKDYFLGSTAAAVVRHSPCSVYVLR